MHILVTGGCGFVGTNVCLYLKQRYPHYLLTALDNFSRQGSRMHKPLLQEHGVSVIEADVSDPSAFERMNIYDVLIHAAAEPSVLTGMDGQNQSWHHTNLTGTLNALQHASKVKARFIFISTNRIYPYEQLNDLAWYEDHSRFVWKDESLHDLASAGINEDFTTRGSKSFYGASKYAAEGFIKEYQVAFGLDAIINRCGLLTGPHQLARTDQGVIALWASAFLWQKPLRYIGFGGKGKQVRDVLHINDFCRLLDDQIHRSGQFDALIYNVGGGREQSISLLELSGLCQQLTGHQLQLGSEAKTRPADIRIYYSDLTRIKQYTGWQPLKSVRDCLEDILHWLDSDADRLRKILH